jgi:hypothetical protein
MDFDGDGKIDRKELLSYPAASFTETFVNRIFEEIPLVKGKMVRLAKDYLQFRIMGVTVT